MNIVDRHGIVEVRTSSEDPTFVDDPIDMFEFQRQCEGYIPDDYCHKDRYTTEQRFFFCLVCDCDLRSKVALFAHTNGQKHIKKCMEKKRLEVGIRAPPPHVPLKKEKKHQRVKDILIPLVEKLKTAEVPPLGLEYVTEFICQSRPREPRMYTCSLEGCKSAWGESESMFNHLCGKQLKHNKNYLAKIKDNTRILSMTKNEIVTLTNNYVLELDDSEPDYSLIIQVKNDDKYFEIRNRPDDWTEKKALFGKYSRGGPNIKKEPGSSTNANMTPLGSRDSRKRPLFGASPNEEPPAKQNRKESNEEYYKRNAKELMECLKILRTQVIKNLREREDGSASDSLWDTTKFCYNQYQDLLKMFSSFESRRHVALEFDEIVKSSAEIEELYMNIVDKDIQIMKGIRKRLVELEEEVPRFVGSQSDPQYKRLEQRLVDLSSDVTAFNPEERNKAQKLEFRERVTKLQKKIIERGMDLSYMLMQQMDKGSVEKSKFCEEFKNEIQSYVTRQLQPYYKNPAKPGMVKIGSKAQFDYQFEKIVTIVYNAELNKIDQCGLPWSQLKLTTAIMKNTDKYIVARMAELPPVL